MTQEKLPHRKELCLQSESGAFAPDILITQKTNIYIQNRTTLRKLVAIASAPRTKTAL